MDVLFHCFKNSTSRYKPYYIYNFKYCLDYDNRLFVTNNWLYWEDLTLESAINKGFKISHYVKF